MIDLRGRELSVASFRSFFAKSISRNIDRQTRRSGGSEGSEVRVEDETAQFHKSVQRAVETPLPQQQNDNAAVGHHQDFRQEL